MITNLIMTCFKDSQQKNTIQKDINDKCKFPSSYYHIDMQIYQ